MDTFFVGLNNREMNLVTKAENLVKSAPVLAERFDAIATLRTMDDGSGYKGQEFRRVASIVAPLLEVAHLLEPDFLKNKRRFYGWLDANPEYCTYDRRAARARTQQTMWGWTAKETTDGNPTVRESPSTGSEGGSS